MKTPTTIQREDLRCQPLAESLGWIVAYHPDDFRFNRMSASDPARVPHFPLGFLKGDVCIWRTDVARETWTSALILDGFFIGHRAHDGLEDALRAETARFN